jgi:hypothetical protein
MLIAVFPYIRLDWNIRAWFSVILNRGLPSLCRERAADRFARIRVED